MFSVDKLNKIATPFYYYDTQLLRQTLQVIKLECEKHNNFHVHYAVKANANPKYCASSANMVSVPIV